MRIRKMDKRKGLVVSRKVHLLETQLTAPEKQELSKRIKEFTVEMKDKIEKLYPDDHNKTIMMDDQVTAQRNQILRKIKFFKQKQMSMPDFIRKTR
mmetsp:Transcript_1583/g.2109  ORF Transcript_1583/g.2109 Transcript_1583/m.2109 type:complete len:96 (+) Transcript_1583:297-584(+)